MEIQKRRDVVPPFKPIPSHSHILSGWPWRLGIGVEGSQTPGPPNVPHPDAPIRGSAHQEVLRGRGIREESPGRLRRRWAYGRGHVTQETKYVFSRRKNYGHPFWLFFSRKSRVFLFSWGFAKYWPMSRENP